MVAFISEFPASELRHFGKAMFAYPALESPSTHSALVQVFHAFIPSHSAKKAQFASVVLDDIKQVMRVCGLLVGVCR